MFIRKPHENPISDHMKRDHDYGPRDPYKRRVANEPPEWRYWNKKSNVSLDEAILLTLNFDPRSYYSDDSHSWRYSELSDFAESSILDGSLQFQYKSNENFRAVDWLQWLNMVEYTAPDEWRPFGFNRGDDSSQSANAYEARYKSHYDEAVKIAIAMAESNELSAPTCLTQLYYHMEVNMNDCPVNYGSAKKLKMATVQKYVRSGGGNPLKDPRFLKVLAQNPKN